MRKEVVIAFLFGGAVCLPAILFSSFLHVFTMIFLTIFTCILGLYTVFWIYYRLSTTNIPSGLSIKVALDQYDDFKNKLHLDHNETKMDTLPIILGRSLDTLLQQIIDLTLRDFVNYHLKDQVFQPKKLCDIFRRDIWTAFACLHERLLRLDAAKLIACDAVTKITNHFEKIRELSTRGDASVFKASPQIMSKEEELDFLKQISELFIMFLLPRSYSLPPAKYFYRDILTVKVLYTAIDTITDPDYINQNIISYFESTNINNAFMNKMDFDCTNNFEEFIKLIQKSEDIQLIKNKRNYIITKLMEATTIVNIKRSKGIDVESEKNVSGLNKTEFNAIKKLKKCLSQLNAAKRECDKRLTDLGDDGISQSQLLPLSLVLDNIAGRRYLSQFLDEMACSGLVGYWSAVEELKSIQRKHWHQVGAQIYYTYIKNSTIEIKIDTNNRKRMEAFLLGDKGPEIFYEIQQQVVNLLEEKYYHQFINSTYYETMINVMENGDAITEVDSIQEYSGVTDPVNFDNNLYIGDHSNYSKRKLNELDEKLTNKLQALQALRSSLKPDSRVLTFLEKEVSFLQGEKRQVEAHLTRTEIWGENLGKWRAIVQSADVTEEKETPLFVIVVEMDENAEENTDEISSGWVVSRTLTEFQELHRKLRTLCSNLKNVDLPSHSLKFLFGISDKNALEKAKLQVQKYLEFVLNDERLNQSEAIYVFLSPSADHLKETYSNPNKSKFSLSTLFKSNLNEISKESHHLFKELEDDDLSYNLDTPSECIDTKSSSEFSKSLEESKDSIADPLYSLMGEIFDLRGVFKYVRKTLISFVQATYNRTINRQVHDSICYCFSEDMLHFYFSLVLKNFWPGGELYKAQPEPTIEEVKRNAKEAKEIFLSTVPDFFKQLFGSTAAKNGTLKIYNTFQNKQMNKQLFYDLLEQLLYELFPEISTFDVENDILS